MPQQRFYATRADADLLLGETEPALELRYYRTGLFPTPEVQPVSSLRSGVRRVSPEGPSEWESYLGLPESVPLQVRTLPQQSGGVLYAVDELLNPDAITLNLGGEHGPSTLVPGLVGAVNHSPSSKRALSVFTRALKKHYVRIKAYHVGPQALALLRSGGRLTAGIGAAAFLDLREGA